MRTIDAAFGLYCLLCLAALTWPGFAWLGNRVHPTVLGLPLSLAWNVGWVLATFLVLAAYDRFRRDR